MVDVVVVVLVELFLTVGSITVSFLPITLRPNNIPRTRPVKARRPSKPQHRYGTLDFFPYTTTGSF